MKKILFFNASWCGPCKQMKPHIDELISEGYQIQDVDIDRNKDLAEQYNVRSVPTTVIEENGIEVDRFIGATSKQSVLQRIS